ncbi:MAG: hypothetical protein APF77_11225 [Clostridia bacterium BRH_c25]|nr:MAG: hypothetical protein APF77_11225 [Clostridia bacterium BRH_c25]
MNMKKGAVVLTGLLLVVLMLCAFALDVDNKDKVAIFNNIEIPEGITVNGDAIAIFGDVTVKGDMTGDAVAIFGNVSVSGTVSGDAVAVFGKIAVNNNGMINGDASGIFGGVDKAQNGTIRGEIADVTAPFNFKPRNGLIPRISYGDMIGLFVAYAFSCLALLIAPDRIRLMAEESRQKFGRRFGMGFLIFMLFIPASVILSVLLAITLVGIIFIPFIFIAFVLLAFVGMVALEVAIGYRITGYLEGRNSMYIHLLVGVVLVYVMRIIPILGWLAYLALVTYAIGVAVDTRLGASKVRRQASNV